MKKRQLYVLIIFMSISLIGIITFQYIWIKNAVSLESEQFDYRVNEVMNSVIKKLETKETVFYITQTLDFDNDFIKFDTDLYDSMRRNINIKAIKAPKIELSTEDESAKIRDSVMILLDETSHSYKVAVTRIKDAIDQMVVEFSSEDDPIRKRLNISSLDSLIKNELLTQGINIKNEYGIVLSKNDSLLPYHSDGFNEENMNTRYRINLFPDDIYAKSAFLLLDFPGKNIHLLKSISLMLSGSAILTLIIIITFARTIFIILRQKKISEIKSDFINNMTHEFKTPISTISLATDSIRNPKVLSSKEKILYYSAIIKEENNRMNKQIENILQMSLLEKHNMELNITQHDIHSLIKTSVRNMSLQLEKTGGQIETILDAKHFFYNVDEIHFLNIMNNLIDNAIKYSLQKPEITLRTINDNDSLLITIQDKGIGMTKDVQKKIFEKFYRLTLGDIHNTKGFGLGLSYVKAILEIFGGDIYVESKPRQGTVFTICLKK